MLVGCVVCWSGGWSGRWRIGWWSGWRQHQNPASRDGGHRGLGGDAEGVGDARDGGDVGDACNGGTVVFIVKGWDDWDVDGFGSASRAAVLTEGRAQQSGGAVDRLRLTSGIIY